MEENEKCKHRIINKTNCATCHEKFCCECYAIYIKKNEKCPHCSQSPLLLNVAQYSGRGTHVPLYIENPVLHLLFSIL